MTHVSTAYICFEIIMSRRFYAVVQAKNVAGTEGLVPENYIRIWNPVDDEMNDDDMNEVNVDDDIPLDNHRQATSNICNCISYSDSQFLAWHLMSSQMKVLLYNAMRVYVFWVGSVV